MIARYTSQDMKQLLGQNAEYMIAGAHAWRANKVLLGQTALSKVTTIYNSVMEGIKKVNGRTYVLIKCEFPSNEDISREYFVVDLLNNIHATDLESYHALSAVMSEIASGKIDPSSLQHYHNELIQIK